MADDRLRGATGRHDGLGGAVMRERYLFKRGEELPHAKLTEADVRLIRQVHAEAQREIKRLQDSCKAEALAEKFGVHVRTIEKVLRYESWRHVA